MNRIFVSAAMMAVLYPAPVLAEPKGYICEVKDRSEGGFVQSPVVFVIDLQKQSAVISDPIILMAKEKPVSGDLKRRADGTYRVRWRVTDIPTVQYKITASYTAVLDPVTSKVSISGKLEGAGNQLRGTGLCTDLEKSQIGRITGS